MSERPRNWPKKWAGKVWSVTWMEDGQRTGDEISEVELFALWAAMPNKRVMLGELGFEEKAGLRHPFVRRALSLLKGAGLAAYRQSGKRWQWERTA